MEHKDLQSLVQFPDGIVGRSTVFETERLWSQVLCFARNQTLGPIADEQADAMWTVLAGEAAFTVGSKRKRAKQWGSVLAPAGHKVFVANASTEPLVLLVVAAPPPAAG